MQQKTTYTRVTNACWEADGGVQALSLFNRKSIRHPTMLTNQEIAGWHITQIYRNKCQEKVFIEIENVFL